MSPNSHQSAHLILSNVTVGYDGVVVVKDVNLELADGEIGCLLGPSGCGKSTLLRAIAGLEPVMAGEIKIDNTLFSKCNFTLAPERRGVGFVFQDMALFPHFTVAENISFGLKDWTESDRKKRVKELLTLVGLEGMEDRYPHSLSGGQQQRVALIRAMGPKPKLLLLDEPFSGLDTSLRESLVSEVRELLLQEEMTALLVTHDQTEAFDIADKVAIIGQGGLVQCGPPQSVYHQPKEKFVAEFIGIGDFLSAVVLDEFRVNTCLGILKSRSAHRFLESQKVNVLLRPGDIVYDESSSIKAEIVKRQFRGTHFLYRIRLETQEELYCLGSCKHRFKVGEKIGVKVDINDLVLFDYQSE